MLIAFPFFTWTIIPHPPCHIWHPVLNTSVLSLEFSVTSHLENCFNQGLGHFTFFKKVLSRTFSNFLGDLDASR